MMMIYPNGRNEVIKDAKAIEDPPGLSLGGLL